jgi:hypothetical protein
MMANSIEMKDGIHADVLIAQRVAGTAGKTAGTAARINGIGEKIDGIAKKMFANLKEIGDSTEVMCPAIVERPGVARIYTAASQTPLRPSVFLLKTAAYILGCRFFFV